MDVKPLLDRVLDLLVDMVCVVDEEGHYVFVSAACERLLGYTQEEMIGKSIIELTHPDDWERTLRAAEDVMSGNLLINFENRYLRKDGRVVHLMWSARWSESDRVRLAVARDVTAPKRSAHMRSAIYRISEAAHAVEGLFALYQEIHKIIRELLPAANFSVALYDKSSGMLSFPYFVDERERKLEPQPLGSGTPIAKIIHTGQPLLMSSADAGDAAAEVESVADRDCKDWLGVPLVSHKGVMGALVVHTYCDGFCYTEEDKHLLQFVSTELGAAIDRQQTETHLRYMARYDALTDIPNRILFNDRFDMALKRARRDGERLILMYLDLDGFKDVNDTFGHEAGDRVLREAAQRLKRSVRESDIIGRMGGDEFTVLLTNISGPEYVDLVVEKIRTALAAPFEVDGEALTISASIGIAIYPDAGDSKEQLLRYADAGMYAAKRRGGREDVVSESEDST